MPRCHHATYLTAGVLMYCVFMIFIFSGQRHDAVSMFQIKADVQNNVHIARRLIPEPPHETEQEPVVGKIPEESVKAKEPKESYQDFKDPAKPQQPKDSSTKPKVKKVIIATYMRCGSSLTGDIIQQHPDVFYSYEPLWQTQHNYLDGIETVYLNGTKTTFNESLYWTPQSMSVQVIETVLSCNFQNLDIKSLQQPHMRSSRSTVPYMRCRHTHNTAMKQSETESIQKCLDLLLKPCHAAKIVAAKLIRVTMNQVERLLQLDPDINVIYLVRDPRGSLHSQSRIGEFNWNEVQKSSLKYCQRFTTDMRLARELTRRYPQQFLTIRYEEIAEHPQGSAEYLYNFLGLDITERIRRYIFNITFAAKLPNCAICTTRSNSTETAYKWRNRMSIEEAKSIQESCPEIFDTMGYRKFQTQQELVDTRIPTRFEDFGDGYNVMRHSDVLELDKKVKGAR